ncbi:hypothetical protein RRG08_055083 [Elysia crispata]|uniref:Uncharacterized protein n=1 Tax=Elysia crispata TaxID=231223 RepID=A0AAE1E7P4_9GAST|nr:hypothetical protein RRG08_055083 [Elysia crispata]
MLTQNQRAEHQAVYTQHWTDTSLILFPITRLETGRQPLLMRSSWVRVRSLNWLEWTGASQLGSQGSSAAARIRDSLDWTET